MFEEGFTRGGRVGLLFGHSCCCRCGHGERAMLCRLEGATKSGGVQIRRRRLDWTARRGKQSLNAQSGIAEFDNRTINWMIVLMCQMQRNDRGYAIFSDGARLPDTYSGGRRSTPHSKHPWMRSKHHNSEPRLLDADYACKRDSIVG